MKAVTEADHDNFACFDSDKHIYACSVILFIKEKGILKDINELSVATVYPSVYIYNKIDLLIHRDTDGYLRAVSDTQKANTRGKRDLYIYRGILLKEICDGFMQVITSISDTAFRSDKTQKGMYSSNEAGFRVVCDKRFNILRGVENAPESETVRLNSGCILFDGELNMPMKPESIGEKIVDNHVLFEGFIFRVDSTEIGTEYRVIGRVS